VLLTFSAVEFIYFHLVKFSLYEIYSFLAWTNMKITRELEDRQRFDELQFQRAGKGSIQKTYKYDPTQPRKVSSTGKDAIAAKKRDR
jgi:hypothetical protein